MSLKLWVDVSWKLKQGCSEGTPTKGLTGRRTFRVLSRTRGYVGNTARRIVPKFYPVVPQDTTRRMVLDLRDAYTWLPKNIASKLVKYDQIFENFANFSKTIHRIVLKI